MERELFDMLKKALRRLGRRRKSLGEYYTDATIVEVYCWAVLHDRSVLWACQADHWPPGVRRGRLPSQSVMSRRLRTASVRRLLDRLEALVLRPEPASTELVYAIDGKSLPIARHSRDPHAGYGRGAGGMAKGYKLHVLIDLKGTVRAWRVAPMNGDERTMACRMVRHVSGEGYLLADANYNSNRVFAAAARHGLQMISPRRKCSGNMGLGRQHHAPSRIRSIDMLENRVFDFGRRLHTLRRAVERFFGTLTSTGGGLTCLPAWVRRHHRVRLWVQAKLLFNQLRADRRRQRVAA